MAYLFTFAAILKHVFRVDMQTKLSPLFLAFAFFFAPIFASAQHEEEHHNEGDHDIKTEIKQDIQHHLKDSHDYHLTDGFDGHPIGFPLPVILWDESLVVFMSSKFHHGHELVEENGSRYMLYHNKIYSVQDEIPINKKFTIEITTPEGKSKDSTYVETIATIPLDDFMHKYVVGHNNLESDIQEGAFVASPKPLDFSLTKNVFNIIGISLLLLWLFGRVGKSYKKNLVPTGAAKFFEPLVIFVRDEIARPNIGEKHYKKYMSFLLTVFFFIWLVNLFGLTPLGINITNSIAVTFALALLTFIITQFSGKKDYWMHIFWMPGVPWPMKIILAPIELLGVFIKPFALMIRLYANITAGHIVLMSLLGLMFIFKSWLGSPLSFGLAFFIAILELLVAALQAYIFTMLSALYFGSAVAEHHEEH